MQRSVRNGVTEYWSIARNCDLAYISTRNVEVISSDASIFTRICYQIILANSKKSKIFVNWNALSMEIFVIQTVFFFCAYLNKISQPIIICAVSSWQYSGQFVRLLSSKYAEWRFHFKCNHQKLSKILNQSHHGFVDINWSRTNCPNSSRRHYCTSKFSLFQNRFITCIQICSAIKFLYKKVLHLSQSRRIIFIGISSSSSYSLSSFFVHFLHLLRETPFRIDVFTFFSFNSNKCNKLAS